MSANTTFQTVNEQGWRRGFKNLLRHENSTWWRSRRWWINMLIWLVLINGPILAMLSTASTVIGSFQTPAQMQAEALTIFAVMAGMFGSIGAVIAMQGAIIDEKKSGTAAWIMSKPTSRPAFILAKLLANIVALLIIIVGVQSIIAAVQMKIWLDSPPALGPFLAGIALLTLHQLFYVSFALMLGTLFSDRGPVIGIPIGILFSPMFIMSYAGDLAYLTPWPLIPSGNFQGMVVETLLGQPLFSPIPIVATLVWSVIFVGIALWRFGREEF